MSLQFAPDEQGGLAALPTIRLRRRWGRVPWRRLGDALTGGPTMVLGPGCTEDPSALDRLFVCVDGSSTSESLLPLATELMRAEHLDLWLLNVADEGSTGTQALKFEVLHANYLRRVAYQHRDAGLRCNWVVLHGPKPGHAIVEHADEAGLIALTTHGASGRCDGFGPVARRVLRRAHVPVIVLRPRSTHDRPRAGPVHGTLEGQIEVRTQWA